MADTIKISTVIASIAAQSITVVRPDGTSGTLTILDTSALPEAINQADCPLLTPRPQDFLTSFSMTRDSFGADAAYKSVNYTLNYLFYYAPVGQGAELFEKYDEMVTAVAAVLLHFSTNTNLSGSTEFLPGTVNQFSPVADGAGTLYHGCVIPFVVMQYMET